MCEIHDISCISALAILSQLWTRQFPQRHRLSHHPLLEAGSIGSLEAQHTFAVCRLPFGNLIERCNRRYENENPRLPGEFLWGGEGKIGFRTSPSLRRICQALIPVILPFSIYIVKYPFCWGLLLQARVAGGIFGFRTRISLRFSCLSVE